MLKYLSEVWGPRRGEPSAPQVVVDKFVEDMRTMSPLTSTSLGALGICLVVVVTLGIYYHRRLDAKLSQVALEVAGIDRRVDAKAVVQAFIMYLLELSVKAEESMDMALFMSEMRRKAKARRPRRPVLVEARVPEFLPNLKAERCQKDGVAVLDINEESEIKPDKKEQFTAAHLQANKLDTSEAEFFRTEIPESQVPKKSPTLRLKSRPIQC
ncbi:hypothetical protein J6590_022792 [Homalodisca vitripennis]|nr:hypothetical protein J6590_098401 [Homalodisca vitripennis]KAG8327367.1 hypothetical protein J6590_022792 [Homalodisca vitripennis]